MSLHRHKDISASNEKTKTRLTRVFVLKQGFGQKCTYKAVDDSHSALPDEEIVALVQGGNKELFGVLMDRYEQKLSRYGRKFLSSPDNIQDIVQDVFTNAYQNIKSFDTSQKFNSWIYRIAHNAYVNALRKNSHMPIALPDLDTLLSHAIYEDPSEIEREQKDIKVMIEKCLEKISPKYKEVLLLRYYEDMDYKEIANILKVPIGTVSIRLKRAREYLKKMWDTSNNGSYGT